MNRPDPGSLVAVLRRRLAGVFSRRSLFVVACLVTLVALTYTVENWRGRRAWEKCRRDIEARGEVLDWHRLIPPPVPDEQNIFKAPKMTEWFVRDSWSNALSGGVAGSNGSPQPFTVAPPQESQGSPVVVAEVEVIASDAALPAEKTDAVLTFDQPAARVEATNLLAQALGPTLPGPAACLLLARPRDQIRPVHLVVQADTPPTTNQLASFLLPGSSWFQLVPQASHRFRVRLSGRFYTAADYLAASEAAGADLEVVREALKRPGARMESDYQRPFEHPIPNFVRLRTVAQMLAQRAQCYLLLAQPEAAWRELELLRDVCKMLEAKPASNCPTLVEAMINVAITGLYTQVIADGLRLRVWREPELAAIQQQAGTIDLLPLVRAAFNAERAAVCFTFETYTPAELSRLFAVGRNQPSLLDRLRDPTYLFVTLAPRGWLYQNMCADAIRGGLIGAVIDTTNNLVVPRQAEDIQAGVKATVGSFPPYSFMARQVIPNFLKATQTLGNNQTLVNEAYVACGLERYRLAHGQYPENLDALVPQFAARLPRDVITGQPLHYRRTGDGKFLLYGVGWNEKDDGGVTLANGGGDWVWR